VAWLDFWRHITVAIGEQRLRAPLPNQPHAAVTPVFRHLGTGVITLLPGQTNGLPWLVTAKHVIDVPGLSQARLRFAWHDAQPLDTCLGPRLQLRDASGQPLWVAHPNPTIDLACIPFTHVAVDEIGRAPTSSGVVSLPAVLSDPQYAATPPFVGMGVMILGYPGALDSTFLARAVARQAMVSWVSPTLPSNDYLLLDGNIIHGNSGGPVFTPPSGTDEHGTFQAGVPPRFLGIVIQTRFQPLTVMDPTGQPLPAQAPSFIGIGVAEPAERVRELLQHVATQMATKHPSGSPATP